jgi:hypothetical protein
MIFYVIKHIKTKIARILHVVSYYDQQARGIDLPIKWINDTGKLCPKGQFVYFVGNLIRCKQLYYKSWMQTLQKK